MRASLYTRVLQYTGILLFLFLVVTGYSMFFVGSKLHKGAKGSVHSKEVADWSLEATIRR